MTPADRLDAICRRMAAEGIDRLVAVHDSITRRVSGRDRGLFSVPEDFDAPLAEDILNEFES